MLHWHFSKVLVRNHFFTSFHVEIFSFTPTQSKMLARDGIELTTYGFHGRIPLLPLSCAGANSICIKNHSYKLTAQRLCACVTEAVQDQAGLDQTVLCTVHKITHSMHNAMLLRPITYTFHFRFTIRYTA